MDLTPYFGGIISAAVFVIGSYIAMKGQNEKRFAAIEASQAAQDVKIAQALDEAKILRDLSVQIAQLSTKLDDLKSEVSKHNSVIERTYKLENDVETAFHRIDDLRADVHPPKIGGTA